MAFWRAILPAVAFFSLALALEHGWIRVNGVRLEAVGRGSTIEYRTGTSIEVQHRYPQYDWLPTDVYLDSGSATFGIAGHIMRRTFGPARPADQVTIYTPSARIEAGKRDGARFTVTVEPARTTVVCDYCSNEVSVRSRGGTPYSVIDGGTTVVPLTTQTTGAR
jgi:hypothetical protein